MSRRPLLMIAAVALLSQVTAAAPFENDPVVRAMKDELARAMDKLELPGVGKPYYVSYMLYDTRRAHVVAELGAIVSSDASPRRTIDIDLRVGDRTFDNSNFGSYDHGRSITLPIEDDYGIVRRELWRATDREYKHAAETLERKRAVAKAEMRSADTADSFSSEPASHLVDDRPVAPVDQHALETLAKKLSAPLRNNPDAYRGTVTVQAMTGRQVFVSSEGSIELQTGSFVRVQLDCETRADDGMPIHRSRSWYAESLDKLPPESELLAEVARISQELSALRKAPVVDDYSGPVLFEGTAAPQLLRVLVAEDFAGTPAPKEDRPGARGQGESELVGKIGQRILPAGTYVVDDPTLRDVGKRALSGATHFDEEGMPAQKVSLVEDGTFKRFLMSRIPRKGFEHTNGHAASSPFSPVRAHPMNLLVTSKRAVADPVLRKRALAAAKEQGLPYVLAVEELDFHFDPDDFDMSMFATGSLVPRPAVLKRIYPDGHEELVRGGTFGPVPQRSLKDLLGMGKTPVVYDYLGNGMPSRFAALADTASGFFVSIVAPTLLFRDLDVKKPRNSHSKPPIVSRPH